MKKRVPDKEYPGTPHTVDLCNRHPLLKQYEPPPRLSSPGSPRPGNRPHDLPLHGLDLSPGRGRSRMLRRGERLSQRPLQQMGLRARTAGQSHRPPHLRVASVLLLRCLSAIPGAGQHPLDPRGGSGSLVRRNSAPYPEGLLPVVLHHPRFCSDRHPPPCLLPPPGTGARTACPGRGPGPSRPLWFNCSSGLRPRPGPVPASLPGQRRCPTGC